jgi:putative membrane protein
MWRSRRGDATFIYVGRGPGAGLGRLWMRFLLRILATAVALWVATALLDGITVSGASGWANAFTLLGVAAIFGVINAVLKPIIQVLGCLFYLVTLGLIALVVNALLFLLVSWLAGVLNLPFHVEGFWSAFWGAIIVGIVSWAINVALPDSPRQR